MLSMGLQVKARSVLASARPARVVILCIVANYVLVPLTAIVLLHCFQANPMVAAGFLILAVCPAAPVGAPFTAMAKGNLPLAIAMMVILAALSAVLSPALLGALLVRTVPQINLQIDYFAIVKTLLIFQLLPLAIGLGLHQWMPNLTRRLARPVQALANILMLALIVAIIAVQYQTLAEIRLQGWIGMALLLAASLGIGWIGGGAEVSARKAIAITTRRAMPPWG